MTEELCKQATLDATSSPALRQTQAPHTLCHTHTHTHTQRAFHPPLVSPCLSAALRCGASCQTGCPLPCLGVFCLVFSSAGAAVCQYAVKQKNLDEKLTRLLFTGDRGLALKVVVKPAGLQNIHSFSHCCRNS